MDYSKLSDGDLMALYNNDYTKLSDDALKSLYSDNQQEQKKGIGTPYDWIIDANIKASAALEAPFNAVWDKKSIGQAYQDSYNKMHEQVRKEQEQHPVVDKINRLTADTAAYATIPTAKAAQGANWLQKAGAVAKNIGLQGTLQGALEGANQGDALTGAKVGTGIAAGVQALPVVNKIAKPILQVAPKTANLLARSLGRIQPETLQRAVQPDSKALDLTREQAQNLLMDTTERIQKDYRNLLNSAGEAVNEASLRLPEDRAVFASSLKNSLNDIYRGHSVSGVEGLNPAYDVAGDIYNDLINKIDLASDVKDIGRVSAPKLADIMNTIKNYPINWQTSTAKDRQALLKQIYGDFSRRLGNLSPELRNANKAYSKLAKFDDNEGLKQIINPSVIDGNKIDSASSALRNYNSTVTKGNTNRNIQDLEALLVAKGKQPFLNDIDDVNAAMDLLNARSTGDSWLANLTTQLSRPALKGIRYLNQKGIPQAITNFSEKVSPEVRRILTPALVQLGVGE